MRRELPSDGDPAPGEETGRAFVVDVEQFVVTVMPDLVRMLTARVGDRATAEELAQEALSRVWLDWSRVSTLENPVGWTYRVALNLSASRWRRRRARSRAESLGGRPEAAPQLLTAEAVAVRDAMTQLSRRQREVILLRYFGGLNVAETAEALDISEGTVKTLTSRALARLRSALGDDDA